VVIIEGHSPDGYRLEIISRDGHGVTLLRDSRRGVYHDGRSIQEFRLEIPPEAKGVVILVFKVFGGKTRVLLDSGERAIALTEARSS
jgi:hypothetical protein